MTVPEYHPTRAPLAEAEEPDDETPSVRHTPGIIQRCRRISWTFRMAILMVLLAVIVALARYPSHENLSTPPCNLTCREVLSAIHRAKTPFCKAELEKFGCALQTDSVYPQSLPNLCQNSTTDENLSKRHDAVRILFVFTVHGRDSRQIRRLLQLVYQRQHYYLIHVDRRSNFLFHELLPLEQRLPNLKLLRNRHAPIWGGASLLTALLDAMRIGLETSAWRDWEYFINLSESDLPIKTVDELEEFLARNYGRNFVKSHGLTTEKFVKRQGLEKSFFECDDHMWRTGVRTLPRGIVIDGGSDWVALHRGFCQYLFDEAHSELLSGLRIVFNHTLLPAESFFHTVLRNSRFCHTYSNNNLRLTNWNRAQGCNCQYKHVVDWCGCSPNVFRRTDEKKILSYSPRPIYFARKFDSMVDLNIINTVLADLHEFPAGKIDREIPPHHRRHWLNLYTFPETYPSETAETVFESLAALTAVHGDTQSAAEVRKNSVDLLSVHMTVDLKGKRNLLVARTLTAAGANQPAVFEYLIGFKDHFTWYESGPAQTSPRKILNLLVSTDFDHKEEIFRNYAQAHGPDSDPGLSYTVAAGPAILLSVVWIDPADVVAGSFELNVTADAHTGYHQPDFRKPLRPGTWTVYLMYNWKAVCHTKFLIVPRSGSTFPRPENLGPPGNIYVDHNFTSVARLFPALQPAAKLMKATENGRKIGEDLLAWVDELVADFYDVKAACVEGLLATTMCRDTAWSSYFPDDSQRFPDIPAAD